MLAIVIPYYKSTFFEATLISLSKQTDKRFTVFIGNDASQEDPFHLLEKYKDALTFTYKKFNINIGKVSLTKQWERCIAMVGNEEWVMILGDDDKISNNCVAAFYANLKRIEQLKINVVRFATVVINHDLNNEKLSDIHSHPILDKSTDFLIRKLTGDTRSSLSEYIFNKKTLLNIKFKDYPLAWHTDDLAVLECSGFNLVYTINEAVVFFRRSGLNISSRNDNMHLKNTSSFYFFDYLLKEKFYFFDSEQRNVLFERLEKSLLQDKKNRRLWLELIKLYLYRFQARRFLFLIINACKSILKIRN